MLSSLLGRWSAGGPVYVGIRRKELIVRHLGTGESVCWPAAIATDVTGVRVTALGREATARAGDQIHWPFNHPRTLVDNFQLAEKLLQGAFREVSGKSFLRSSPAVVMHSLETWEGGLTAIEWRVLRELAYGAGAREVYLWQGSPPSDEALRSGEFKRSTYLVKS